MTTTEYECPFVIKELTEEEKKQSEWLYPNLVRLSPTPYIVSVSMKNNIKKIINLKPRPDDVWLIGLARSGTTLTQEILYLLGTDLNYEKAAAKVMDLRFPVLHAGSDEKHKDTPHLQELGIPAYKRLEDMKEKRFIKSHFGLKLVHPELLEVGCKVVFIARNPKDVIVSSYYYPQFHKLPGFSFEKLWPFVKMFAGSYFEILKEAWENRNHKNVLFLIYEEINADKHSAILKMADFLEKRITTDQVETLLKHVDIHNFKKNKSVNNDHLVDSGLFAKNENVTFIRSGKTGGWKALFPPELVSELDDMIKKGIVSIPGFKTPESWE